MSCTRCSRISTTHVFARFQALGKSIRFQDLGCTNPVRDKVDLCDDCVCEDGTSHVSISFQAKSSPKYGFYIYIEKTLRINSLKTIIGLTLYDLSISTKIYIVSR